MKKQNYLLVISNHNPNSWSEEQKAGWDYIEYQKFPEVDPELSTEEVMKMAKRIVNSIHDFYSAHEDNNTNVYVTLQGEYSLCKAIFDLTNGEYIYYVFPTSKRIVEEVVDENGEVSKISKFKFVQWRKM